MNRVPKAHICPEPQKETTRVRIDIRPCQMVQGPLNAMTCHYERQKRRRGRHVETEAETAASWPQERPDP